MSRWNQMKETSHFTRYVHIKADKSDNTVHVHRHTNLKKLITHQFVLSFTSWLLNVRLCAAFHAHTGEDGF